MSFSKGFKSILTLNRYKEHIHWLYGMSKDFGLAGWKTGFVHTYNEKLNRAIKSIAYFHVGSTLTNRSIPEVISDFANCRKIFENARQTLKNNFAMMKEKLATVNIGITEAVGGPFCLISLKKYGIDSH